MIDIKDSLLLVKENEVIIYYVGVLFFVFYIIIYLLFGIS